MKKTIFTLTITLAFGIFSCACLASENTGVDIHGFISQGYLRTTHNYFYGDTVGGSLEFNEFGINLADEPVNNIRVGLQILARDLGSNGDDELTVDWAFGDYRWKDWLGVRVGKIKTPKGLYNETRDEDMLRTYIFLPQSVYSEILRDTDLSLLGAGGYGDINLKTLGFLAYQFIYGTQNISPNESVAQALQGTTAYLTPVQNDSIKVDSKYVLSLLWDTPLEGLRFGATYDSSPMYNAAHATMSIPAVDLAEGDTVIADFDKYQNTVLSAEYTVGNLVLVGEYLRTAKNFLITFHGMPHEVGDYSADGWYLGSSYQLREWLHLGAYYSESYNKTSDREGNANKTSGNDIPHRSYFKDVCLTMNFIVNDYWNLKLEGHRFIGTQRISALDQVPDAGGNIFAHKDWGLFAAKITFSF